MTGLRTTLGYDRLATHRSFETGSVVRGVFLALGAATSDNEGDPHSPLEGFFHAPVGWILKATPAERERYCKRLLSDPVVTFVDRTNYQALLAKPDNGVSGLPLTREDCYTHAAV